MASEPNGTVEDEAALRELPAGHHGHAGLSEPGESVGMFQESAELDDDAASTNSEKSEIALLINGSESDDDMPTGCRETPADVAFAKTRKQQEAILKIIDDNKQSGSRSIDLSKRNLQTFPEALLDMPHIEYMYLEGNEIVCLPDEFFKVFPNLRWLDLRNNILSRIPSLFLSSHTCLRNLLLEGNNLRNLPLELGLVKSLHGLNIAGNPLDFPPQEIIEKGTQHILSFLKDMMDAKNNAKMSDLELNLSQEVPEGLEHVSASSDDWNTTASLMDLAKRRERMFKSKSSELYHYHGDQGNVHENDYTLGARSAELHRPGSYTENKYQRIQKLKKAGALGVVEKKKKKKESNMAWKVNPYPAPPSQDYVAFKMNEEKQVARVRELKEKTDAILQRRKDDAMLRNWRDDAKVLQQKKYAQHMVPGQDYKEPGEQAPFGVEKEMMKVLTKEERLKADLQKEKELKQQRTVSPATRQRIEKEKQERIRELEKRIKEHTAGMVERRKQPKGTPQHEMEIARRELEIAEQLHNELLARRKDVEYRFKAFSADVTNTVHKNRRHVPH